MNDLHTLDDGTVERSLASSDAAPQLNPRMVRRAIVASVLGSGLEWFDFLVYGYFSKIIAQVFFPSDHAFVSIALS